VGGAAIASQVNSDAQPKAPDLVPCTMLELVSALRCLAGGRATRALVPLNRMCSRKCATPLLASVSKRLPELIHTPTVVVSANGMVSVATRSPLGRVVTCTGVGPTGAAGVRANHKAQGPPLVALLLTGPHAPFKSSTWVSGRVDSSGL
jgi:hypothetical protein